MNLVVIGMLDFMLPKNVGPTISCTYMTYGAA